MAYKFQSGVATMSGSLIQEGNVQVVDNTGGLAILMEDSSGQISGSGDLSFGAGSSLKAGTVSLSSTELRYLDGISSIGTSEASKAMVMDSNNQIGGIAQLSASYLSASLGFFSTIYLDADSLVVGSTTLTETEIGFLDGITPGTALASKALVLDASKDIGTIRNLTIDGTFSDGNYTFDTGGNVTGLGSVDCGAIDSATSNITTGGKLIIDVDGSALDTAGALVLGAGADAAIYWDGTDLRLDTSASADISFRQAGNEIASLDDNGLDMVGGTAYKIGGTSVLNATTLGSAVVNSSLTSLGTIASLVATDISASGDLDVAGDVTLEGAQAVSINNLANEALYYRDSNDSNYVRRITFADYATAIAGVGITATNGVLSTDAASSPNAIGDIVAPLEEGFNYQSVDLSANRTWSLPTGSLDTGDKVIVKAAVLAGNKLTIAAEGAHQIDDSGPSGSVIIESDNGALSFVYVAANHWKVF